MDSLLRLSKSLPHFCGLLWKSIKCLRLSPVIKGVSPAMTRVLPRPSKTGSAIITTWPVLTAPFVTSFVPLRSFAPTNSALWPQPVPSSPGEMAPTLQKTCSNVPATFVKNLRANLISYGYLFRYLNNGIIWHAILFFFTISYLLYRYTHFLENKT